MAREKQDYRDILEILLARTDGKIVLSQTDAAEALRIDRHTAARKYGIKKDGITVTALARMIAG